MNVFRRITASCMALACSVVMLGAMVQPVSAAETAVLYGDVNGDGAVNLVDVIVLNRFLVGGCELSNYRAADANANCIVDHVDMKVLNAFIVHTITSLPYTEENVGGVDLWK